MSVSHIPGLILSPVGAPHIANGAALSTLTINTTNQNFGMVFQAPENITIDQVGFNYNSRTGNPGNLIASIAPITSTGIHGTDITSATIASSTLTYGGATGSIQWITLGASVSLTRGTFYSFRIRTDTTGWDASNFIIVNKSTSNTGDLALGVDTCPYYLTGSSISTGIWGGLRNSSSGRVVGQILKSFGNVLASNTSLYYGSQFTLPSGWASCVLNGIVYSEIGTAASSTDTFALYSVSGGVGTQIATTTRSCQIPVASSSPGVKYVYFPEQTLTSGTTYFIGLLGLSGRTTNGLKLISFTNSAEMDPYQRSGFTCQNATLNTTGNAVTTTNEINFIFPCIKSATVASGGGGGGSFTMNFNQGFGGA